MKAKNTTAEPRRMPLQPYLPNSPPLSGMNGCQFAVLMKNTPSPMKATTTTSLITTMMLLRRADSLVPMMSRRVSRPTMTAAGRLTTAVAVAPPASLTTVPGAPVSSGGMAMPMVFSRLTT